MSPDQIIILTAPKHSGKTTLLTQWAQKHKNIYGIASPMIQEKRHFMDLQNGALFPMESDNEEESLTVGKYRFSINAFSKAKIIIEKAALNPTNGWVVIDELGPLELNKNGFYLITHELLNSTIRKKGMILVVREGLVGSMIELFQLTNKHIRIITPTDDFFNQ